MNNRVYVSVMVVLSLAGTIGAQALGGLSNAPTYLVVDDFESYVEEEGNPIGQTWFDGSSNGTNSLVGIVVASTDPSVGRDVVRTGKRCMSLGYDNTRLPFYSEVQREFAAAQDWTVGEANALSLRFKGDIVSFAQTTPDAFTISGFGADIWSNWDQFRFAYRRLTGNGAIVARIDSIQNSNPWAKIGVMIRESLHRASTHASMFVTPDGRRAFQNRPVTGSGVCLTANSNPGAISLPCWVKVERQGSQFTGYYSTDGVHWMKQPDTENSGTNWSPNPQGIGMADNVYIGLAVTSHGGGVATTATFSGAASTGAVRGPWEVASVGLDQPGNSPDGLYLVVEDSTGAAALAMNPDLAATNAKVWTDWQIPFGSLTGVNLRQVRKVYIGVGGRETTITDNPGRIYIDDIRLQKL